MDLKDKTLLITGGAKGIGRVLVEESVKKGANLGVLDIDEEALANLKKDLPGVYCGKCDVGNPKEVETSVANLYEESGNIDILVNNAAVIYNSLLISLGKGGRKKHDLEMWNKVIQTNLSAVFYTTVQVVDRMVKNRTRGVVVNVSSICASGNLGQGAYSAAKAGVEALTVTWAKELALWGIRVVGVAPGFAKTETTLHSMTPVTLKEWEKHTPLGRMAEPKEVVSGILFVIENDFFNGRTLQLDGGLRI